MMGEGMKGDFLVILGMFLYSFSFSVEMFMYSLYESESEVSQSRPTLCNPMGCSLPDSSVHGISQARILVHVHGQEYWSGLLFPSPGGLPNPGIKPGSPALQADSLPVELPDTSLAKENHTAKCNISELATVGGERSEM